MRECKKRQDRKKEFFFATYKLNLLAYLFTPLGNTLVGSVYMFLPSFFYMVIYFEIMKNIYEILKINPVILAPMAGFTDLAFRETVRENGGYLAFSEMVSAKALLFKDKKTYDILKTTKLDKPLCVQIFGHEPDVMAEGAKIIEDMGFEMIDINCGCPAPKVYKNGDGSSLMKNPRLIYDIVHSIRKACSMTLSVKLRIGYDWNCANVVECAQMCELGGADFVTIHGRTRDMNYSGNCHREYIKAVKKKLFIPVIGNGDVTDSESYKMMIEETKCDGVMVGRAALGNPFIIKEILEPDFKADKELLLKTMLSHINKMCDYKGDAIREARALMLYYMGHMKMNRDVKIAISKAQTLEDVEKIISNI